MFDLTPDQEQIRDLAKDFAKNEVAPGAAKRDAEGKYPADVIKKLGELGFMGVYVPEEWGGAGMDPLSYILAMEEIAVACASTATIMSVSN